MASASSAVNVVKYDPVSHNDQPNAIINTITNSQPQSAIATSRQPQPKCRSACCGCPSRYSMTALMSVGLLLYVGMRGNIWAAMLDLARIDSSVADENQNSTKLEQSTSGSTYREWSPGRVAMIDSSENWGRFLSYIPGGFLAAKYPAQKLFGFSLAASGVVNLAIPIASTYHHAIVILIRVLQGIAEGIAIPASYALLRHWAPPLERSVMIGTLLSGFYGGVIAGMAYGCLLTEYFGWREQFYTFGSYLIIWWLCWFKSSETPSSDRTISEQERVYIQSSINAQSTAYQKPPLKTILGSKPVWAIILASFARNWSHRVIMGIRGNFFRQMLFGEEVTMDFDFIWPQIAIAGPILLSGLLADRLQYKKLMSTTVVRKTFTCGGLSLEAVFLVVLPFVPINVGRICLVLAAVFSGVAASGIEVNYLDVAPRYASVLVGISGTFSIVAQMASMIVAQRFIVNGETDSWTFVLLVAGCINLLSLIFYAIFASGDKQSWAEPLQVGGDSMPRQTASDDGQTAVAVNTQAEMS